MNFHPSDVKTRNLFGVDNEETDYSTDESVPPEFFKQSSVTFIVSVLLPCCFGILVICVCCARKKSSSNSLPSSPEDLTSRGESNPLNSPKQNVKKTGAGNYARWRANSNFKNPIDMKDFETYMSLPDITERIAIEYNNFPKQPLFPSEAGSKTYNILLRNRYTNIIPYDHSRVILPTTAYYRNDYINASFINCNEKKEYYIAAQGPMQNTLVDFWRMIWDHKINHIVMITREFERVKPVPFKTNSESAEKCARYWPAANGRMKFGDLEIRSVIEENFADYVYRKMQVTKQERVKPSTRDVIQYQYMKWPDHGVPDRPSALLAFLYRIKAEASDASKIVVNCSAGVGRTGAFIALNMLIERLAKTKKIDICSCIWELRQQRISMIQMMAQYMFLHKAMQEYCRVGMTAMPVEQFLAWMNDNSKESSRTKTIVKQFCVLELRYTFNNIGNWQGAMDILDKSTKPGSVTQAITALGEAPSPIMRKSSPTSHSETKTRGGSSQAKSKYRMEYVKSSKMAPSNLATTNETEEQKNNNNVLLGEDPGLAEKSDRMYDRTYNRTSLIDCHHIDGISSLNSFPDIGRDKCVSFPVSLHRKSAQHSTPKRLKRRVQNPLLSLSRIDNVISKHSRSRRPYKYVLHGTTFSSSRQRLAYREEGGKHAQCGLNSEPRDLCANQDNHGEMINTNNNTMFMTNTTMSDVESSELNKFSLKNIYHKLYQGLANIYPVEGYRRATDAHVIDGVQSLLNGSTWKILMAGRIDAIVLLAPFIRLKEFFRSNDKKEWYIDHFGQIEMVGDQIVEEGIVAIKIMAKLTNIFKDVVHTRPITVFSFKEALGDMDLLPPLFIQLRKFLRVDDSFRVDSMMLISSKDIEQRIGLWCSFLRISDMIENEAMVDVYYAADATRDINNNYISTLKDYIMLHDIINKWVKSDPNLLPSKVKRY